MKAIHIYPQAIPQEHNCFDVSSVIYEYVQ